MTTVAEVGAFMEAFAPKSLAADWDNVGLLIGDSARPAARIMTSLSLTSDVVEEAVAERVDLVIVHHPLPFRPLKTITTDSFDGGRIWRLASAGISVYSPHTGFDSAARGINQRLQAGSNGNGYVFLYRVNGLRILNKQSIVRNMVFQLSSLIKEQVYCGDDIFVKTSVVITRFGG